jgi:hypothetical protein
MNGLEVEAGGGIVSLKADVPGSESSPFAGIGVIRSPVPPRHDLPAIDPRRKVVLLSDQYNRKKLVCAGDNAARRGAAEDGTGAEISWLSRV